VNSNTIAPDVDTINDSATRSFAPHTTNIEPNNTFSSEESESFYIGLGEDGFCPSNSIHDSDISETDDEAVFTEDELDESDEEDGDEVNTSTEDGGLNRMDNGVRPALDTSILTEIVAGEEGDWEDEKKEEADDEYAEAYEINRSNDKIALSPNLNLPPVMLQTTPLKSQDSDDDDEDFVSSALKNYLTETEANLASFMSSIEGMTTTPGRIKNSIQEEEDLDDCQTPLQLRFGKIDEAEYRGEVLFRSPPAVHESAVEPSGLEQRFDDEADSEAFGLRSSPLVNEALAQLPSTEQQSKDVNAEDMEQSVTVETSGLEATSPTKHTLPQSPLPKHEKSKMTSLVETNTPTTHSPLDVAAAEFSTKSTEVMEQLQNAIKTKLFLSPQQPSHMEQTTQEQSQQLTSPLFSPSVDLHPKHSSNSPIQNQCDDSLDSAEDIDAIPASLREMFKNADKLLQKELASPMLKSTSDNISVDGVDTFCDDYIRPPADSLDCVEPSEPCNVEQMPFASPKLESAAKYRANEEENYDNSDGEDDTTFDTANNFSIDGAREMYGADDSFFDAEEFASFEQADGQSLLKDIETDDTNENDNGQSLAVTDAMSMGKSSGNSSAAADSDDNVDITQTLDRVGEYLKRMTMGDSDPLPTETDILPIDPIQIGSLPDSPENVTDGETPRACNSVLRPTGLLGSSPNSNIMDESMLSPLVPNVKFGRSNSNADNTPRGYSQFNLGSSPHSNIMDQSMLSPLVPNVKFGRVAENIDSGPHEHSASRLESGTQPDAMDESMESPEKLVLAPDESMASEEPASGAHAETPANNHNDTLRGRSPSTMEASARSDDMDESMFMPNVSMEVSIISSPAPAVGVEQQQLPATSEEDEDSGALSDEEFFPNRDLSTKATTKVVQCSNEEKNSRLSVAALELTTRARLSLADAERSTTGGSRSSTASKKLVPAKVTNRSQPMSKPSPHYTPSSQAQPKANSPARPTRQNSKKSILKSPPSNNKPAKKRTKLSTITNTADSPQPTAKSLFKPTTKPEGSMWGPSLSAIEKKRAPRTKPDSNVPKTASTALVRRSTESSPRITSMRRSLVTVAKSQRQTSIPKPSPRENLCPSERIARLAKPRSVSVTSEYKPPRSTKKVTSNSQRLARLARPRAVVRREMSPTPTKKITQSIISAAKPPSFLNRDVKTSSVKSTEELEAEEMSSIKPFKARRIKGTNSEISSRFNTPRAAKPIVATLAESIHSYNFRGAGTPIAPISPKAKPPSFLRRPSATHHLPMSTEERELEECKQKFKACPLPLRSTTKLRPPSRHRESRKFTLTTPRPPKLHTSTRSEHLRTPILTQDEIELQNKFHARPLPANIYGRSFSSGTPSRYYYEKTPQLSTDEVELRKQFHALPLPTEIYGRTVENDGTPVHIRLEQQHEQAQERKKQMLEEEMEEMRRNRERKATPLPRTNWEARPIRIEKSHVELVQPRPPRLSLDVRSKERKQYDDYLKQVREAEAAAEAARLAEEARAEEEEVKRKRSTAIEEGGLCFKATPISIRYE
jgi:hypothetical protein